MTTEATAPTTFAGRLTYVVEEDTPARAEFCQTLRSIGSAVVACDDFTALNQHLRRREPDIIVVGYQAAGATWVDRIRDLRRSVPSAGIFMRGAENPDASEVVTAINNGATDVFHRKTDPRHVVESLRAYLSRSSNAAADPNRSTRLASLTRREREVLERLIQGKTSKEVGLDLKISSRTVEVHRAQCMKKLGARNGVDLARKFLGG
jgi:two-component system, LuxR family, response regulator FixJ